MVALVAQSKSQNLFPMRSYLNRASTREAGLQSLVRLLAANFCYEEALVRYAGLADIAASDTVFYQAACTEETLVKIDARLHLQERHLNHTHARLHQERKHHGSNTGM